MRWGLSHGDQPVVVVALLELDVAGCSIDGGGSAEQSHKGPSGFVLNPSRVRVEEIVVGAADELGAFHVVLVTVSIDELKDDELEDAREDLFHRVIVLNVHQELHSLSFTLSSLMGM
jgi:hypothetical protein